MQLSNEEMSQGQRANVAGKAYEDILIGLFENYGFEVMRWAEWRDLGIELEDSGKVAIKQFPYRSIYNHRGQTEWVIVNNYKDIILRVEIKSQRAAGSVDEKLPYISDFLIVITGSPDTPLNTIIESNAGNRNRSGIMSSIGTPTLNASAKLARSFSAAIRLNSYGVKPIDFKYSYALLSVNIFNLTSELTK